MMRKGSFSSAPRPPMATERLSGAVTWFSATKGFGFIKPTDGSEDVFVHVSVVQRAGLEQLKEGATISCEVAPGKKGRQVTRMLEVDDSTAVENPQGEPPRAPRPPRAGGFGGDSYGDRGGGFGGDRGGFGGGDRGGFGGGDRGGFGGGGFGGGDRGGFGGGDRGGFGGGFGADRGGPPGESGEGTVKWFNATKGFGFITPDSGGKDVFLHASVLRRAGLVDVQPGQRVRFSSIERDKGPEARTLELDGEAPPPVHNDHGDDSY